MAPGLILLAREMTEQIPVSSHYQIKIWNNHRQIISFCCPLLKGNWYCVSFCQVRYVDLIISIP